MGININRTNQTNIILISVYITYSVLSEFLLPDVPPIPLARILIQMPKHRRSLRRLIDRVYVNATARGLVIIQIRNG